MRVIALLSALAIPWCLILLFLSPLFPTFSPFRIFIILLIATFTLALTLPKLPDRPPSDDDF
jgi:hypothetical protein